MGEIMESLKLHKLLSIYENNSHEHIFFKKLTLNFCIFYDFKSTGSLKFMII